MITSPLTKSIVSPIVSRITAISASTAAAAAANVEIIINGTFDTNSDSWPTYGGQPPESITIESGQLNLAGVQHSAVAQIIPTEIGESYPIAAYVEQDGYIQVKSIDGTTIIDNLNNGADGTFFDSFVALETQTIIILALGATGLGVFDNVSVKQSKLVINGGFDTDMSWDKGTGWLIGSGVASCDGTQTISSDLSQSNVVPSSTAGTYSVTFTLSGITASSINVFLSTSDNHVFDTNGTYTIELVTTASTSGTLFFRANSSFIGALDNISVVKV
ncbi:MAG: hypothetical protein GY829_16155 [Gammaproteobacteria bacterium]|nr:hypothetical protein [Gammaproteobacteria bacterium]